ncbi:TIGR03086 family protein [Nocardioides sp. MAH-18]|uniref:TIGR03086 family protein n=1 Tax=Nocardioides agri TaxID=2682843 RepID=A0A6L6XS12_9ACTN|nr:MULTISPECIES: TIGR03086 family metal-binding protein [unclassified Nocardioides]MBA2955330.1 TIGR03086 family protein [Nocardioides sp. CGMCC 1.13656]MVQ50181.1 TIGR03086 family protein [Nocardioides sp. MAH-18]
METLDFAPATRAVAAVVTGIGEDQLGNPTPCPGLTVADLLDHLGGLALAFTWAATKQTPEGGTEAAFDGSRLSPTWRAEIPAALDELAVAWTDPAAYAGMTMAGPVEMPGEVAALVALDEVVVHGWDLARATGLPYDPDEAAVLACLGFASSFDVPPDAGAGPFGPPVPVPDSAPALDRLAGATGRDPAWRP